MILKCKMCGGDLIIKPNSHVAECSYCGTCQTIPGTNDENKIKQFERANRLRMSNVFDKAEALYETIILEYPDEAEAYWGLVLCRYGIEYVDDPITKSKIPTCHRLSYESVLDDQNYLYALEKSDDDARKVYEKEGKRIEEIRRSIIKVSSNEDPVDIFICYKEKDEKGERTEDSILAQRIYEELVREGYKVFFSRVSLADKLGQEYEPLIFGALTSAKVMLVVGTSFENLDSVWVRNEWKRFLDLVHENSSKVLIPCYKGIDVYDLPKEFLGLQAQNLGELGALQDLLRGVKSIINRIEKNNSVINKEPPTLSGKLVPGTEKKVLNIKAIAGIGAALVVAIIVIILVLSGRKESVNSLSSLSASGTPVESSKDTSTESENKNEYYFSFYANLSEDPHSTSFNTVDYGVKRIYWHVDYINGPQNRIQYEVKVTTPYGENESSYVLDGSYAIWDHTYYWYGAHDNNKNPAPLKRGTYTVKMYVLGTDVLVGARSVTVI